MEILVAIHGYIVGAGLTYWLMQQRINQIQKSHLDKMRELREELERNHELRMQETIKSLQKDYQVQLNKETHKLEKAHEARLEETIKSLETQSQHNKLTTEEVITFKEESAPDNKEVLTETPQQISGIETDSTSTSQVINEQILPITDTGVENYSETTTQVVEEKVIVEINQVVTETVVANLDVSSVVAELSSEINKTIAKNNVQNGQELEQKILIWKNSKQLAFIPQLIQYSNYPNSNIRSLVALAIGEIAAFRSTGLELQRAIPVLGKLSQDPVSSVRKSAVEALSNIQSEKVIPFLQKALRDSDNEVVKSANTAMNKFKFYRVVSTKKTTSVTVKKEKR